MKRFIFEKLKEHAAKKQITLLVGARQTGKTTLLHQLKTEFESEGRKVFFITLENPAILELLNSHPDKLFQVIPPLDNSQKTIVLIDEVQYLAKPSNFLKYLYDQYSDKLKLIVSGSSGFYIDEKFKDSLAGRKRLFTLPTLSFKEMLYFKDRSELGDYTNEGSLPRIYLTELTNLWHEYLLFGGYPEVVLENQIEEKKAILDEIASSYVKKDAVEASVKYPDAYLMIMQVLSAQIGGLVNFTDIGRDTRLDHNTVEGYIRVMRKSFHITLIKPFYRSLSKELRRMSKVYFNDLGLRNHFVRNYNAIALRDDKGALLENYVFRLFLDHSEEDDIKFWRTQKQQEVDFVIENRLAYEVKFSEHLFKENKYAYFREKYPQIPLHLIHSENVLEFPLSRNSAT
ncbi:ATP-binding protein [candidate division KSB1 bacterium]|nr:ATP-binding protein [candidate division KSB1 bacterium]